MPPLGARTLFFIRESLPAQTGPLAPELQQQRLPPDTSSQFIEESRFRLGLPRILPPSRGPRLILPPGLLKTRALALDFLAIYCRIAAPA